MELVPGPPPQGWRASIATTYDTVAVQRDEMGEAEWRWPIAERVLATLRLEQRTRLLELGAGVGYTSRWFADRGMDVVATDLAPAQVELCLAKGLDARVADLYDLPFERESFDAVWGMNCIHHVADGDLEAVLPGVADVLVPGGLLYLGVWGGIDASGIYDDDFYRPPRYFTLRSDETLISAVGAVFDLEWFETFTPERDDDGLHMQSVLARRRPARQAGRATASAPVRSGGPGATPGEQARHTRADGEAAEPDDERRGQR